MFLPTRIPPWLLLRYAWGSLTYYLVWAVTVYVVYRVVPEQWRMAVPIYVIAVLSTALAIFLGFNNSGIS